MKDGVSCIGNVTLEGVRETLVVACFKKDAAPIWERAAPSLPQHRTLNRIRSWIAGQVDPAQHAGPKSHPPHYDVRATGSLLLCGFTFRRLDLIVRKIPITLRTKPTKKKTMPYCCGKA